MTRLVNTGKNGRNHDCVIHTNPDCMHVMPDSLPVEDAPVDGDELELCVWCTGAAPRVNNQSRECPFCGEQVSKLPPHLPCEASP